MTNKTRSFSPVVEYGTATPRYEGPPAFISVTRTAGGHLSEKLMLEMGVPKWVEVEFDGEYTLRVRPAADQTDTSVGMLSTKVKLPLRIRKQLLGRQRWGNPNTIRIPVTKGDDGWWYATSEHRPKD